MTLNDRAPNQDELAAMPAEAAASIASEIDGIVRFESGRRLLMIGASPITTALLTYPIDLVGFDRSPSNIAAVSRAVSDAGRHAELHVADGCGRWAAADHSVDVVFCSRPIQHIPAEHFSDQLGRVLSIVGGWLITGNIARPKASPQSRLLRKMRRLLASEGTLRAEPDRHESLLSGLLERQGAQQHPHVVAARWRTEFRPNDSIAEWEAGETLGGVMVRAAVKQRVLDGVRAWALQHYGSLDDALDQEVMFELHPVSIGNE